MAALDMLFGRQGMHIPACPVGCLAAETTPGQAAGIQMGPLKSRPQTQHIGLLLRAKQGTNNSEKSQSSPREELK